MNGDGLADITTVCRETVDGAFVREIWITFGVDGGPHGGAAEWEPTALGGSNGFRIKHATTSSGVLGYAIASAGDVNADGVDDMLISNVGLQNPGRQSGAIFVVYGKQTGFDSSIELASLAPEDGFEVLAPAGDGAMADPLSGVGDMNDDGVDDFVISSTNFETRTIHLIFGRSGGYDSPVDPDQLDGANGYNITDDLSIAINACGDFNGDDAGDLLTGLRTDSGNEEVLLLLGGASRLATLDLLDGAADGQIPAENADQPFFGQAFSTDDIDGADGDDFIPLFDGDDIARGRAGADEIFGGAGEDALRGDKGDDILFGGVKSDALYGQRGDDTLSGGGEERLVGGLGVNILTGGGDRFIFRPGHGQLDQITDFEIGADRIVLKGAAISFADLEITGETDALVTWAPDQNILLLGVVAVDLSESDFVL